MDKRQIALDFIQKNGPSLPGQLYKEIGTNILITSAFLSELSINGHVKISNVKVGGSPLYYIPGQENLLENFIDKLNEKTRKAVFLLKENQVLRDSSLEPVMRVAIREAKDFAKPLYVNNNDNKEIFWRWYLFNDQELIKKKIFGIINSSKNLKNIEKPQDLHNSGVPKINLSEHKIEKTIEEKQKEKQKTLEEEHFTTRKDKNVLDKNKITTYSKDFKKEKNISEKDEFFEKIEHELLKTSAVIITYEKIKKEKEYNIIIEIPSAFGKLKYFCKFFEKKRITDKDISSAFVEGQMKKLPVIVLSTGDLAKKAEYLLRQEMQGITFKKINI